MKELDFKKKLLTKDYQMWIETYQNGGECIPQILEIDPTSSCNFQCECCINSDIINRNGHIKKDALLRFIGEFAQLGGKGVIFIGGGEPLMYPFFSELIEYTYSQKLKIGVTTNGYYIDKYLKELAYYTDWVRVSVDAGTTDVFNKVRPCKDKDAFNKVICNIKKLNEIKRGKVGYSYLLMDGDNDNLCDLVHATTLADKIGCDYIEIKPMVDSQHFLYKYDVEYLRRFFDIKSMLDKLQLNTRVLYANSIEQYHKEDIIQEKDYIICPSLYLRTVVTNYGIYPCPYKRGFKQFNMGSVYDVFKSYAESLRRRTIIKALDPQKACKHFCIRNDINIFLNNIKEQKSDIKKEIVDSINDIFV